MFNRLFVLVIPLVIFIAGCGSDSNSESDSSRVGVLNLTVSYVEQDTRTLVERAFADGDRVIFSFISGYFFGAVGSDILVDVPLDSTVEISLEQSIFTES